MNSTHVDGRLARSRAQLRIRRHARCKAMKAIAIHVQGMWAEAGIHVAKLPAARSEGFSLTADGGTDAHAACTR